MKTVAVLLARGGSKEIPRKNLIDVCGQPLISYGIGAAVFAGLETWVSTDDEEIAAVSKEWGAKVLMRPAELATDTSQSEDALLHFAENVEFDRLVFIQPTSPLLKLRHIKEGLRLMEQYDSVFSGNIDHWTPKWGDVNYRKNSAIEKRLLPISWKLDNRPRRQDAAGGVYTENGAFYITSKERLMESECRYSGNIGCYEMLQSESFQVDSYDDLRIIEAILGRSR
jgi:CMP-N,N'-diacetyllegionaminic acid synthase